jgi:DNA-binding transcriptional LysR family regulator
MPLPHLPDLSSRQLRAVLAVDEYRSFIAAAAFLKISQPALTRIVKQVEEALGVPLFSRTTRNVVTTVAGKEFAALAERILNDLKIGVANMRKHGQEQHGQIVVASVLSLAGAVLPALIADYSRRFPGVQIHLREGIHAAVLDDLRAGVADFGIGHTGILPEGLIAEPLRTERFYVVLPAGHPLACRLEIDIEALKDAAFVSFSWDSATRRILDEAAAAAGFAFRYAMTANRLATLLSLVRKRIGLAIVPAGERPSRNDRSLISRPLVGARLSYHLGIMRIQDRELSPAATSFLGVVKEWILASSS